MAATLGSGSAPPPSMPQPRPRAPRFILGSAPSRFEATLQPSSGPPKAADCAPCRFQVPFGMSLTTRRAPFAAAAQPALASMWREYWGCKSDP